MARFNKENLTVDDQEERIVLAALRGGIWLQISFMTELAQKTIVPPRVHGQGGRVMNAKDTISAFIETSQMERRQSDNKRKDALHSDRQEVERRP